MWDGGGGGPEMSTQDVNLQAKTNPLYLYLYPVSTKVTIYAQKVFRKTVITDHQHDDGEMAITITIIVPQL